MPSEITMLAEPAVLTSAPKTKIKVGVSISPPATPRTLLAKPMLPDHLEEGLAQFGYRCDDF